MAESCEIQGPPLALFGTFPNSGQIGAQGSDMEKPSSSLAVLAENSSKKA